MSISIDSSGLLSSGLVSNTSKSTARAQELTSQLSNLSETASDEEIMESCKAFESYFVQKILQYTKETMAPEEDDEDNQYKQYFGDILYEKYAEQITESGQLGLAQSLYEAMKRNG